MAIFCTLRKQKMILELDVTVLYSMEYVHYIVEKIIICILKIINICVFLHLKINHENIGTQKEKNGKYHGDN